MSQSQNENRRQQSDMTGAGVLQTLRPGQAVSTEGDITRNSGEQRRWSGRGRDATIWSWLGWSALAALLIALAFLSLW